MRIAEVERMTGWPVVGVVGVVGVVDKTGGLVDGDGCYWGKMTLRQPFASLVVKGVVAGFVLT